MSPNPISPVDVREEVADGVDTVTQPKLNAAVIPVPHLVKTGYHPRLRENVARRMAEFRAQRDVRVYKEYYGNDWEADKHDEKYAYAHVYEEKVVEKSRYEYEVSEADDEEEEDVEDVDESFERPVPIEGSAPTEDVVLEEVQEDDQPASEEPLKTQAEWHALFHEALACISTEKNAELWLEPGQPRDFIFTRGDNWDKLSSEDVQAEVFYKTLYTNLKIWEDMPKDSDSADEDQDSD